MSERGIIAEFEARRSELLAELETWVAHESPSDDKAALDKFFSVQKLEFAEDKDGDPVYLAQSAWWLGRAQRDNPKIEFLSTKERH